MDNFDEKDNHFEKKQDDISLKNKNIGARPNLQLLHFFLFLLENMIIKH